MVVVVVVCCCGGDSKEKQPTSNVAAKINMVSFLIMMLLLRPEIVGHRSVKGQGGSQLGNT